MIPDRSRLLIEACLSTPSRRGEAWRQWLQLTRFEDIDPGSFDLLPSVCHLNRDQRLPESDRLRGLFRHNWAVNQGRLSAALPLLAALHEEGLDPVPIKGLALAMTIYGSLGARRLSDIDVLVAGRQFPEAAEIARRHGFRPAAGFAWPRASIKSWPFLGPHEADVDIHARPLEEPWDGDTEAVMRAESGAVVISGIRFRVLSPATSLVVAILHGQRFDGRGYHRWIVDVALLIQSGLVDWDRVGDIARRLGLGVAVSSGLRLVCQFLPPGLVPPGLLEPSHLPVFQKLEHAFRERPPAGLLGALPNLFFLYTRERAAGLWTGSFSGFLREVWEVAPGQGLAPVLARKGLRRVATLMPRGLRLSR